MAKYVVVKLHSFDPERDAVEFNDYREATAYLHWMWEEYLNEELANDSDLDIDECYQEGTYAKVQWSDGDYTEFYLVDVYQKRNDFPADWGRYAD